MAAPFRYAICNEIFAQTDFADLCRSVKQAGYDGIEIAPYTLAGDPVALTNQQRREIRAAIEGEGLCFVGFHWLLMAPAGLHLTTPDAALRRRSWEYLGGLIDLASDISVCQSEYNAVMVLGSPKQRSTVDGMSRSEATDAFIHELAHTAPHAESRGIRILVEALSPDQTDVITTLAEAVDIVKQIGSPAVQSMFDTHNAVEEADPHPELVRRFAPYIQHVHLNEMDGREPGAGDYDFALALQALAHAKYSGWISLEILKPTGAAPEVARESLRHLKRIAPKATNAQTV